MDRDTRTGGLVGVFGAGFGLLLLAAGSTGARLSELGAAFSLPVALGAAALLAAAWLVGAHTARSLGQEPWFAALWLGPLAAIECCLVATAALMIGTLLELGLLAAFDSERLGELAVWTRLWADLSLRAFATAAGIGLATAVFLRALRRSR